MFTGELHQIFKKKLYHFSKIEAEGILPNSFYEISIAPIPKPEKDITRKENYRPIFMNTDTNILKKILANRIQ